jgi:hypothetical protein
MAQFGLRPRWHWGTLTASTDPTSRFGLQWAGGVRMETLGFVFLNIVKPI